MKIKVNMDSVYARNSFGQFVGSSDANEMEIEDEAVAAILTREIEAHGGRLGDYDIEELIENGENALVDLHENICDALMKSQYEYWLDDANPYCDTMHECFYEDLESGEFKPKTSFEEFHTNNVLYSEDDEDDEETMEGWREYYHESIYDEYVEWVKNLDVYKQAVRFGLEVHSLSKDYEIVLPGNDK